MRAKPQPLPYPSSGSRAFEPWVENRSRLVAAVEEWTADDREAGARREAAAQAICAEVVKAAWDRLTDKDRRFFIPWRGNGVSLPWQARRLARQSADALEPLSVIESSYLVGTLYTALLPRRLRAARGAYYTPPVLAERLLDLAAAEGVDWSTATALDPACGGGAFLAPLAHRILNDHRVRCLWPEERLEELESRLAGIEIDPFAAWLSRVFLQLLAYPISRDAGRALKVPVAVADGHTS